MRQSPELLRSQCVPLPSFRHTLWGGSCNLGVCRSDLGVVTDGLLADYAFNDGAGNILTDAIDPPLNLEIADVAQVQWGNGYLDVVDSVLIQSQVPAAKIAAEAVVSGQITVEAWVTPPASLQSGPARIVSMGLTEVDQNFILGPDGAVYIARVRSTATTLASASPALIASQVSALPALTHLVSTADGDVRRLYIDGVLQGTQAAEGTLANWNDSWPLNVANEGSSNRAWLGQIHAIRIYEKVLSYEEVGRNFIAGPEG